MNAGANLMKLEKIIKLNMNNVQFWKAMKVAVGIGIKCIL